MVFDRLIHSSKIPDEVLSHLMHISKMIVVALKNIYHADGYSIMQNGGKFNDIGHYHLHIFPRYENDGFGWIYGEEPKEVSSEIAKTIRERIYQKIDSQW